MNTSGRIEVLVVGAGPTGLALAAFLARRDVRVRVIDKNAARTDKTKAIGVQAGTLEALARCFGADLSQRMIAAGLPAREAFFHFGHRSPVRIDFSQIPSEYNYILILAQSETERFLEEDLERHALKVERQTEALTITDAGSQVVARLRDGQGREQEVVADYVVGCDGAHSIVRHALGIPYAGRAYQGDFMLGDVVLRWPWPCHAPRMFLGERGVMACFPMKGPAGLFRIIMAVTAGADPDTEALSPEEFREWVAAAAPEPIELVEFRWLTRFRLHHRMAEHFRSGRCFLAGDAAHIHSPVGGQGMNTGIQDALNLGQKLARVLREGCDANLLDDYEKERLPVAREVLRGTDWGFSLILATNRGLLRWLRTAIAPRVLAFRWFQRKMTRLISQIDVARREMDERDQASK